MTLPLGFTDKVSLYLTSNHVVSSDLIPPEFVRDSSNLCLIISTHTGRLTSVIFASALF